MEQEILEEIEKKYRGFLFEVEFVDFRKYRISGYELSTEENNYFEFMYQYNVNFTKDYNMGIIFYNIDKHILSLFKKEE